MEIIKFFNYILINQNYQTKNSINNDCTESANEFSMSKARGLITAFTVTNMNCTYPPTYLPTTIHTTPLQTACPWRAQHMPHHIPANRPVDIRPQRQCCQHVMNKVARKSKERVFLQKFAKLVLKLYSSSFLLPAAC